ncbi:uncharacterized protein BP01DRAFT_352476 [Aspergillus saccharolyticus JOP 1030-1]|uniref:Uncharacterized protein n=1 Tax=Aspergillus saccharolyticus JOP 1030-1 TaxID=1450539 RepID=A0A319AEM8_9EURO|nr:hypothetical protein BP01DRAFT_352476 [Aspergillus saccharolyticus JOP 1030-1]PYH49948.1 hypothetical protein BP01DRAFT_352476 [Aspergillus saccharolyticus JOP 1030-1]
MEYSGTSVLNPVRPDHSLWGRSTPQSQINPSQSTLAMIKPDPITLPIINTITPTTTTTTTTAAANATALIMDKDSPSQSLSQSTSVDKPILPIEPTHPGRGKQLTIPEQICLVKLCAASMDDYDAHAYPKSFWIKIANTLEMRTGRRYSWQSCRRRIYTYVAKRSAYFDAFRQGRSHATVDIPKEVLGLLNHWIGDIDRAKYAHNRCQAEEVRTKPKLVAPAAAATAAPVHKETTTAQPATRITLPEHDIVVTMNRVYTWLRNLPPPEEMEQMAIWGEEPKVAAPVRPRSDVFAAFARPLSRDTTPQQGYRALLGVGDRIGQATVQRMAEERTNSSSQGLASRPSPLAVHHSSVDKNPLKRQRDADEEALCDRPTQRLRPYPDSSAAALNTALGGSVDKSLLVFRHKMKMIEECIEFTFGKIIDRLAPGTGRQETKPPGFPGACELIINDLFKDVGMSVARALLRIDKASAAERATTN